MGRVAMTLAVAVIIWNGAMLGLPINTNGGVLVVGMILAAVSWAGFYKNGRLEKQERRSVLKFIFLEEYLFFVGFVLMAITRGFAPEIRSLEKFMDYGFIRRYCREDIMSAFLQTPLVQ